MLLLGSVSEEPEADGSPAALPDATVAAEARHDDAPTQAGRDIEREQARRRLRQELFEIPAEPIRIERFVVLSRLGQGGMGVVYAAYDERLDRKVAIKVMLPGGEQERARERMLQEARALARIVHPNIVAVHEVGELGPQIYIAMEFVRGCTLHAWLHERERPWPEVLEVFRRAGQGLAAAHAGGFVHRDFKPHNVMVGDDGSVKVLDFGLARPVEGPRAPPATEPGDAPADPAHAEEPTADHPPSTERPSLTRAGALIGTPAYMAPELHHRAPASARSDQFAFCVALFQGLYGMHPFPGQSTMAIIEAIISGRRREPPEDSAVPAWVRRVVLRGLAVDPADRFPSMGALLDALAEDPGARGRRRLAVVAGVVALFGGGFAVAQLGAGRPEPCPDARGLVASAWGDDRRETVAGAIAGSGSPHAGDTWARLEPALDAYSGQWAVAYEDACEAHRQGIQSDALYDRRVACLEQRRTGLLTLVDVLEDADADVVDRAVTAVAGLPGLERCADVEALLTEVAPPPEDIASTVAARRDRLAQAKAHEDAGRLDEALRLVGEVLASPEVVVYPPLEAEALLRQGSAYMGAGQGPAADDSLARAIWSALHVGHDRVAAEAAALRVYARAEQLGQPVEASAELPWAEAMATRTNDPRLRGLFLHNAGAVHLRRGDIEQGLVSFRSALAIRREVLPPDHPDIALSLGNVGRAELERSHFEDAVTSLREAAERVDASLGPRHPQRALLATILAMPLMEQGRWAEAEAELARAEAIYTERLGADALPQYHVRRAQGELSRRRRHWEPARRRFDEALALAEKLVGADHPMLAEARFGSAEVQVAQGRIEEGRALALSTATALETALGSDHHYVVQAQIVVGRLLLAAGQPDAAHERFERALAHERAQVPPDPARLSWALGWVGRAQLELGDTAAAEHALRESLQGLEAALPPDSPPVGDAAQRLAEACWAAADADRAELLFARAAEIMARTRAPEDPELAWLRFLHARAQARVAGTIGAAPRATAKRALERLTTEPGWAAEAAEVRSWLAAELP
jgi:tetratricopeptide (TPR) repeat protein/predicted Ser/Thr protein kinase